MIHFVCRIYFVVHGFVCVLYDHFFLFLQWGLVCDLAYMAGNAGSLFMLGKVVANFVAGPIADK